MIQSPRACYIAQSLRPAPRRRSRTRWLDVAFYALALWLAWWGGHAVSHYTLFASGNSANYNGDFSGPIGFESPPTMADLIELFHYAIERDAIAYAEEHRWYEAKIVPNTALWLQEWGSTHGWCEPTDDPYFPGIRPRGGAGDGE